MSFPAPVTQRYKPVDRLCGMAEWPQLRVEQVRLEAGHLNPVAFQFNEIGFVLAGRTVTSYSGNGLKQQHLIGQGTARICPAGIVERDVVLDAAIECLFISLPPGLIAESALHDYDIDPAKAELVYAGGLVDPMLQRIALSFHDMLCRGIEAATDRLLMDGLQTTLAARSSATGRSIVGVDRRRRRRRKSTCENLRVCLTTLIHITLKTLRSATSPPKRASAHTIFPACFVRRPANLRIVI